MQIDFNGSPYLGIFARANDRYVVVPPALSESLRSELSRALDVVPITLTLGGSNIVGAVLAMNNRGAVVADFADDAELAPLRSAGLEVVRLHGKFNAAGNNVLANDRGAIVNPDLAKPAIEAIEHALGVPAQRGTLAGLKTVGSAAFATAKGVLCHPKATEEELSLVERMLQVDSDIGTVNHGAPYIGAGIVANAKGAAIGSASTGPEINRIEDALGYI